jgi:hypothetical protein
MSRYNRLANERISQLLSLVPEPLEVRFSSIVKAHHELCGYNQLADVLWRLRLPVFAKADERFEAVLFHAARARRSKDSIRSLVALATTIASLESLVTNFANCGVRFPEARVTALALFEKAGIEVRAPLANYYLAMARHAVALGTATRNTHAWTV